MSNVVNTFEKLWVPVGLKERILVIVAVFGDFVLVAIENIDGLVRVQSFYYLICTPVCVASVENPPSEVKVVPS